MGFARTFVLRVCTSFLVVGFLNTVAAKEVYRSGAELAQEYKHVVDREKGQWVSVPFFDVLPLRARQALLNEVKGGHWRTGHMIVRAFRYVMMFEGQRGMNQLRQQIQRLARGNRKISDLGKTLLAFLESALKKSQSSLQGSVLESIDSVMNAALYYRELGGNTELTYSYWILTPEGKVARFREPALAGSEIHFHSVFPLSNLYQSSRYRSRVPTFYIQGELDSATNTWGAVKHWQDSQNPNSWFLLLAGGSHYPSATLYNEAIKKRNNQFMFFLEKIIARMVVGDPVDAADVRELNARGPHKFEFPSADQQDDLLKRFAPSVQIPLLKKYPR
ncbi:MAG: hypothetical protein AB7G93_17270 [Bdellovibrionales bacterium]